MLSDNLLCTLDFQLNEFVNIKLYNNNYTLRNFNLFVYIILYFLQFIDSVCKIPVGEDLSFAKKSMVAKRNRYKEKFPCKFLYILCYNHTYVVSPALSHVGHGSFVYITMNPAVLPHSCAFPWLRM